MLRKRHRRILGQTLRDLRTQAGFSQEELAEKAELSGKYLGEVERGTVNVSVDVLVRLAKPLGTKVHDLTAGF